MWGDRSIPLIICGLFYGLLCLFSVVTGLIYMSGKRKLNPLELPDGFVAKLSDEDRLRSFAVKMGFVTFAVGIAQGISSYAILKGNSIAMYYIALGFTVFSMASVAFKLKGKISAFPLLKAMAYLAIFVILILKSTKALYL